LLDKVDLYDGAYGNYQLDLYEQIRRETYGHDLGQTSWVTEQESSQIPHLLGLTRDSMVLEIGCGSGAYAVHIAEVVGCEVLGLDVNAAGIANAKQLAMARSVEARASFLECDVSPTLPLEDERFDAAFANDVLCHLPGRLAVLYEMFRVLKPGGTMLFSDALVVGGMVTHEEVARRSSIGFYVFTPPGENERLIRQAGFQLVSATNTTEGAATIARRWHDARQKHRDELMTAEGERFEGLQQFLKCVQTLTEQKRLLRFLYVARK
jgi:SAM-dependent methyltransferase